MASFIARDIADIPDAPALWKTLVDSSPLAGLWHTWHWHKYILAAAEPFKPEERSFFIYEDEKPVGLCPLLIQRRVRGDEEWIEAAYNTGLLPWPVTNSPEAEDFAFAELERRARTAGAAHIALQLYPETPLEDETARVERVGRVHRYIGSEGHLQVVEVVGAKGRARERFVRYDKKYAPLFEFDVLAGATVDADTEETYFKLHVLDAGKQTRSRESYARQADLARAGEAFFVRAQHKESGEVAGMLLVSLNKEAAFDNSVAIDPRFADQYVGHALRFRALEELERLGVKRFEMPLYVWPPSIFHIPGAKELNIAHFKEGFSRGNSRAVWRVEKFLDGECLHNYLEERERSLKEFFLLG